MSDRSQLSVPEKLLLAGYNLECKGRCPFSAEDLVVAAWRKYPDAFSLAGYRDDNGRLMYPDSNRVFAEIMGSKPIRKRGFLVKVGRKMYRLTEAGREHAQLLSSRQSLSQVKKAGLARDTQYELKRLLSSKAVEKYKDGSVEEITFYDACSFWGISPRSTAIEFKGRVANFLGIVGAMDKASQKKEVALKHGGETYGAKEVGKLMEVHKFLQEKFAEDIKYIIKRIDERK